MALLVVTDQYKQGYNSFINKPNVRDSLKAMKQILTNNYSNEKQSRKPNSKNLSY